VSTFRLYGPNISNRHPTETEVSARRLLCADTNVRITSHDWHVQPFVKDQLAFRLSGAPSVRPVRPKAKPNVLETRQSYRVQRSTVNPLKSQDFHLISTVRGASIQKGLHKLQLAAGELFSAKASCLPRLLTAPQTLSRRSGRFLAHAKAEDSRKLKIAWRLCSTRKPFRERCPRMRTPERGQLEAY
jgi:hypothetical protein